MNGQHPLAQKWTQEAEAYERDGQPSGAILRRVANELLTYERERALQELTLDEGARESGRHKDTIARWIDQGELENVGTKGRPRVRRGDLLEKLRTSYTRKTSSR